MISDQRCCRGNPIQLSVFGNLHNVLFILSLQFLPKFHPRSFVGPLPHFYPRDKFYCIYIYLCFDNRSEIFFLNADFFFKITIFQNFRGAWKKTSRAILELFLGTITFESKFEVGCYTSIFRYQLFS